MALDEALLASIRPYVSNPDRRVFALRSLPEEVIAVLFAYYSRSREDLRTNLAQLLAETGVSPGGAASGAPPGALGGAAHKAQAFHERWVVGYGHASVAEHAVVHLAVEGVSILASKAIEDCRLASYTEKSTRYVLFDSSSFHAPAGFPDELGRLQQDACRALFGTYLELFPQLEARLRERLPRPAGLGEKGWSTALRGQACDLLRGLLPAATRTNLGLTVNARELSTLLTKLLSSPLAEARALAADLHEEALTVAPTLVRHVAANALRSTLADEARRAAAACGLGGGGGGVAGWNAGPDAGPLRLVRHDADALQRVALALLYDSGPERDATSWALLLAGASPAVLTELLTRALACRGAHDPLPRAFEAATVTVELELDYGAYRDLQRHRLLSPFTQPLGCALGVELPAELESLGFAAPYARALEQAQRAWESLARFDARLAQYVVPLACKVRTLWTLNLRELGHVVELRSSRQGHASYRRVAQQLYRTVVAVHPWLAPHLRVDLGEYPLARA